jgi:hypothetical protein
VGVSLPSLHVSNYQYINHAVVVRQSSFYSVRSYHSAIVSNVSFSSISSGYQIAPVIGDNFIGSYATSSTRYGFRAVHASRLRGVSAERIRFNHSIAGERTHFRGKDVRASVRGLGKGKFSEHSQIKHARFKEKSHTEFKQKSHASFKEKSRTKFKEKTHGSSSAKYKGKSHRSESFKMKHSSSGKQGGGKTHVKFHEKSRVQGKHQSLGRGGFEGGGGKGKSHFRQVGFKGGKGGNGGASGSHKAKGGGKDRGHGNGKR